MATSLATSLRIAVDAILSADVSVQTIAGRTTGLVVTWGTLASAARPVFAMKLIDLSPTGGNGDRRRVILQLSAFAQGGNAQSVVESLSQRARELLTAAAFAAAGLDVGVLRPTERDNDDEESPAGRARQDLDFTFLTSAAL